MEIKWVSYIGLPIRNRVNFEQLERRVIPLILCMYSVLNIWAPHNIILSYQGQDYEPYNHQTHTSLNVETGKTVIMIMIIIYYYFAPVYSCSRFECPPRNKLPHFCDRAVLWRFYEDFYQIYKKRISSKSRVLYFISTYHELLEVSKCCACYTFFLRLKSVYRLGKRIKLQENSLWNDEKNLKVILM